MGEVVYSRREKMLVNTHFPGIGVVLGNGSFHLVNSNSIVILFIVANTMISLIWTILMGSIGSFTNMCECVPGKFLHH